ncbi:MAG: rhomboid family intramembrane serine protease [Verrucomicrobiota bacterium]
MSYRSWPPSQGSYAPLTYVRGVPVDATAILVAVHILMVVLSTIVMMTMSGGKGFAWLFNWFGYTGVSVLEGKFWTLFSYPFLHNIAESHVFFAVEMFFFFFFGREVERYIGRVTYLKFYAMLIIVPAIVTGLASWFLMNPLIYDSRVLHFAVTIGFATIYPNAQFYFGLVAKWMALGFIAIYSLYYMAHTHWQGLLYLWSTCGLAYFLLRTAGVGGGFSWFQTLESWKEQRHERRVQERIEAYEREEAEKEKSVDAILEKISEEGIESLSPHERNLLNRASKDLHQKDQ